MLPFAWADIMARTGNFAHVMTSDLYIEKARAGEGPCTGPKKRKIPAPEAMVRACRVIMSREAAACAATACKSYASWNATCKSSWQRRAVLNYVPL